MDSGLRLVFNSLNNFSIFFLAGGSIIPLVINVVKYFLVFLSLLIDLYISVIKSNTSISFVVSCFSSSITSGNNSYIISISIGLIGQYLDIMLCIIVNSIISS
jgi:hypothetical protein